MAASQRICSMPQNGSYNIIKINLGRHIRDSAETILNEKCLGSKK